MSHIERNVSRFTLKLPEDTWGSAIEDVTKLEGEALKTYDSVVVSKYQMEEAVSK